MINKNQLDLMSDRAFDDPTENSLLEAKDHWEDSLRWSKENKNEDDISLAEVHLKDINARLTKDQQKKYWQNKKQLAAEFLISAETEEQKNDCLKDIANADENLKGLG